MPYNCYVENDVRLQCITMATFALRLKIRHPIVTIISSILTDFHNYFIAGKFVIFATKQYTGRIRKNNPFNFCSYFSSACKFFEWSFTQL